MAVPTPAMPGTGVTIANIFGQDIDVAITGGTLTAVLVNGVTVGTTAGTYTIPPGGTISVTYSAAPSWAWTAPIDISYDPGYGSEDTAAESPGYNPDTVLPYTVHPVLSFAGLGAAVSN